MNESHLPEKSSGKVGTSQDSGMDNTTTHQKYTDNLLEIDLMDLWSVVWSEKRKILYIAALFFLFGLFHYYFGPVEYESEAILIQEVEDTGETSIGGDIMQLFGGGNIRAQGGIAGAARGQSPLPLYLYPSILESTEFQLGLIHKEVEFEYLGESLTLYEYFNEYDQRDFRSKVYDFVVNYTVRLPFTLYKHVDNLIRFIFSLGNASDSNFDSDSVDQMNMEEVEVLEFFDERLRNISRDEQRVINNLSERINLQSGQGLIEVKTSLPDPRAAALTNVLVLERLQEFITTYRVEKAQQNLNYIQDQLELARERYEEAQMELARFLDRNISLSTNVAQAQEEHLRNQRNLAFNVYNQLAEQEEQAKLNVQRETPLFNVLERPSIPTSPSTGESVLLLNFSIILGLLFGIAWVLFPELLRTIRN